LSSGSPNTQPYKNLRMVGFYMADARRCFSGRTSLEHDEMLRIPHV
jgi:hypothetical protein